jgi:hypothetical protein
MAELTVEDHKQVCPNCGTMPFRLYRARVVEKEQPKAIPERKWTSRYGIEDCGPSDAFQVPRAVRLYMFPDTASLKAWIAEGPMGTRRGLYASEFTLRDKIRQYLKSGGEHPFYMWSNNPVAVRITAQPAPEYATKRVDYKKPSAAGRL